MKQVIVCRNDKEEVWGETPEEKSSRSVSSRRRMSCPTSCSRGAIGHCPSSSAGPTLPSARVWRQQTCQNLFWNREAAKPYHGLSP
jgi:hypothetical protein